MYDENMQFDKDLQTKKQEMDEAKKIILDLKRKEKELKWAMERKEKA